jgi:hypothetical protein
MANCNAYDPVFQRRNCTAATWNGFRCGLKKFSWYSRGHDFIIDSDSSSLMPILLKRPRRCSRLGLTDRKKSLTGSEWCSDECVGAMASGGRSEDMFVTLSYCTGADGFDSEDEAQLASSGIDAKEGCSQWWISAEADPTACRNDDVLDDEFGGKTTGVHVYVELFAWAGTERCIQPLWNSPA